MRRALALTLALLINVTPSGQTADAISASAKWAPATPLFETSRTACEKSSPESLGTCVLEQLSRGGAPNAALAFSRRLHDVGRVDLAFMRDFRDTGRVSVAYVTYPLRGNDHNTGCWLVNGKPDLIDVDDRNLLPLPQLGRDHTYAALVARYGDVALTPGRRDDAAEPLATTTTDGGQRFTVRYELRKGCDACEVVGIVRFAFDFDAQGAFKGAAVVSVTDRLPGAITTGRAPGFANPARTLNVQVGETFTLALQAPRASGHVWRLAKELDPAIVSRVEESAPPRTVNNRARDVREVWAFKAVGVGVTEIQLEYARGTAPLKTETFTIVVR
jgi:predicted secreted protein